MSLLSEDNRELSVHITRNIAEKIDKHLRGCRHGLLVGDSITN